MIEPPVKTLRNTSRLSGCLDTATAPRSEAALKFNLSVGNQPMMGFFSCYSFLPVKNQMLHCFLPRSVFVPVNVAPLVLSMQKSCCFVLLCFFFHTLS